MLKIIEFIKQSIEELKNKVTWPTQEELQRMSVLFLIGCLIYTLLVGGINIIFQKIARWIYAKF